MKFYRWGTPTMAPLSARAKPAPVRAGDMPTKWASINLLGAQFSASLLYNLISDGTLSSSWVENVEEQLSGE